MSLVGAVCVGMGAGEHPGGPQNAPAAHPLVDAGYLMARLAYFAGRLTVITHLSAKPGIGRRMAETTGLFVVECGGLAAVPAR